MPTVRPKIKHLPRHFSHKALRAALKRRARQQRFRLRVVQLATMGLACVMGVLVFFGLGLLIGPPDLNWGHSPQTSFVIRTPKIPPPPHDMIILLMGVDVNPEGRSEKDAFWGVRTDTMMLARVRSEDKTISIVSIPRDSKVYLTQSGRIGKINAAFSMGGAEQAVRVVERTTGIPIDRYAVINLHGIRDVIDTLGGVDLFIEKSMRYHDHSGQLHIDFDAGQQHLDGQKVMEYLRFRHDALGDIGRIRRQQKLMSALTHKFNDPWIVTKIPRLIEVGLPHIQTNLSFDEMLQLGWFGRSLDRSSVRVATLPGHTSNENASYWIVRPEAAKELLAHTLLDPASRLTWKSNPATGSEGSTPIKLGLLYPARLEESVNKLALMIEEMGFTVICQQAKEGLSTEILQHTTKLPSKRIRQLKSVDSSLRHANHVIAPIGGTYEQLYCSSREEITLTLGNDVGL